MQPPVWPPPGELSPAAHAVIKRIRRAQLFVLLRQHRHELFADAFHQELATLDKDRPHGHPPGPPAQLALATILQASTRVSDDEVIEATTMDRRWQVVLNGLDCEPPPCSKGTLGAFRQRLLAQQMDRRLLERTWDIAAARGTFGARQLRAARDRSPRWGPSRVEATSNLLGHALRKAVGVIARQQGRGLPAVAREAGAPLVGGTSVQAALALDWDDPGAREHALTMVLDALTAIAHWLDTQPALAAADPGGATSRAVAHQGRTQDVPTPPPGTLTLRQGVAADRRMSVEEAAMRHGRTSRSLLLDGYKRQVLRDLDSRLRVAVGVTPANAPEASVTDALETDRTAQQATLQALPSARASLASPLVQQRGDALAIFCKAWPVRSGPSFPTSTVALDWERQALRGPGGATLPCEPGGGVKFPAATCACGAWRQRCTPSASGRRVSIHPDEALLPEVRARQRTPQGRARWRERVAVEHALAHIGRWQGRRARYRGVQKNGLDLRRCAVVHNLHVLLRLTEMEQQAA